MSLHRGSRKARENRVARESRARMPAGRTRGVGLVRGALALAVLALLAPFALLEVELARLDPVPLARARDLSTVVLDRKGHLLRAFTTRSGRWRLPVTVQDVDPAYLRMLVAYEDGRFWRHRGLDVLAMARAAIQLIANGRIVSGASTLTMQVARLLEGRHERSAPGKLHQIARALQIERRFAKTAILDLYLVLAPFGGNLEGVRAASLAYFGKEPARLSTAEAALLVALPQSPEARRPDRHPQAARRARDRVLERLVRAGVVTAPEAARARAEPVPSRRKPFPRHAPHLSEAVVAAEPGVPVHRLTIERDLQAALETLAHAHARRIGRRISAALLVVDNATGAVRAHVGAADYLDPDRFGAIDMTRAVRSPGSTLKPFVYGLAFEAGLGHPETLIEDRPTRFGRYAPRNFDDGYKGTVSLREALQLSLNVPAVKVLASVGPARLLARLEAVGLTPELPGRGVPSLALALGGVGLTLHDLATLYAGLARGGAVRPLHVRVPQDGRKADPDAGKTLLSPVAAWYVTDILRGTPPPKSARGGAIAFKTGTSYGFRDAWAIGYDGKTTIAAWVGRPDGTATPGMTGITAAAPLLFDAFARLGGRRAPFPPAPPGALQLSASALPPPLRRFAAGAPARVRAPYLDPPVAIAFPPDRAELEIAEVATAGTGRGAGRQGRPVLFRAEGGVLPLTWLVNGAPIASPPHRREAFWRPDGAGFVSIAVIDAKGRSDRVTVRFR